MKCPKCKTQMTRRKSKFKNVFWWGCSNFPRCKMKCTEHPNGSLASFPADDETVELRKECHRLAEIIWGEWETTQLKRQMYQWLEENTKSIHIGKMFKDELKDLRGKLNIMVIEHRKLTI